MEGSLCRRSWRPSQPRRGAEKFADRPGGGSRLATQPSITGGNKTRSATLAVKIVRQPEKIALIGAPSSAAAFSLGTEKAPGALRAAGLGERLQNPAFQLPAYPNSAPNPLAAPYTH